LLNVQFTSTRRAKRRVEARLSGDRAMRAKYAVIGAAALAGVSTAVFSPDGLATACPATAADGPMFGIAASISCAVNNNSLSIVIDSEPTTTIYNLVDNSVNYAHISASIGTATSSFIESKPITTIDNIIDNNLNYIHTTTFVGATISSFIESKPTTAIYNLIDNSINLDIGGADYATISIFIDSEPTTTIYNLVDNSITVQDLALLAAPEPVSLSVLGVALATFAFIRIKR